MSTASSASLAASWDERHFSASHERVQPERHDSDGERKVACRVVAAADQVWNRSPCSDLSTPIPVAVMAITACRPYVQGAPGNWATAPAKAAIRRNKKG